MFTPRLPCCEIRSTRDSKPSRRHLRSPTQPNRSHTEVWAQGWAREVQGETVWVKGRCSRSTTPGSIRHCIPTHAEAAHSTASRRSSPSKCWYRPSTREPHQSHSPMFAGPGHCNPKETIACHQTCHLRQCISTHQLRTGSASCQRPSAATLVRCIPTARVDSHCSHHPRAGPNKDWCCWMA